MNLREVSVARLREYENNPRNNDLAVEKVKYSIQRFGFLFPVVIDVNYVIVAGHTRVRACRELGIQSVPCVIADELTEEQINLFRLVDNKTSEYSDWDFEKLKDELACVDLTLEKNQLLLERFELSAEVFDIEPEQAEIRIPTFNFMGESERPKKPPVSTVHPPESEVNDNYEDEDGTDTEDMEPPVNAGDAPTPAPAQAPVAKAPTDSPAPAPKAESAAPAPAEPQRTSGRAPALIQFRFGEVQFFISQVELDRLNAKYAEFIDSEAIGSKSFATYLLEGVEGHD